MYRGVKGVMTNNNNKVLLYAKFMSVSACLTLVRCRTEEVSANFLYPMGHQTEHTQQTTS